MSKNKKKHYTPQPDPERQKLIEQAFAYQFISKINYILQRIRVSEEGMMQTKATEPVSADSEKPDDKKVSVEKVLFPDEGGVYVRYTNVEHPSKGFLQAETVEIVDEVKKTMMALMRGVFGGMQKSKLRMLLFMIAFRKQFESILFELLAEMDYRMLRILQRPERYCISGREIYRVFNLLMKWYPSWKDNLEHLRNIVCMIWEYDDAYRYPGQDVIVEINKDAIRKDVVKEVSRIIDIYLERDDRGTAQKFRRIKKLMFLTRFMPKLREIMMRFFLELKVENMGLDDADFFHAKYKEGYNWNHANRKQKEEKPAIRQPDDVKPALLSSQHRQAI